MCHFLGGSVRWPIYQYFWLCEAAANVMDDQSGGQGYKSFALGLLMAGIQFHLSILYGS